MPSRAELERAAAASRVVLQQRAEKIRNGHSPDDEEPPEPSPAPQPPPIVVQEIPPPEPAPAPLEAPPETPPVDRDNDPGYLRHLATTAEGRAKAAERALEQRERFFEARVREMGAQIQTLQGKLGERAAKDEERDFESELDKINLLDHYDQAEIDEHGEAILRKHLKAQLRTARKLFKPTAPPAEVQQLRSQIEHLNAEQAKNREQVFFAEVTAGVPQWRALHKDATFLAWLAVHDPVLGTTRDAAIKAAKREFDSSRAVAIMKQFVAAPARQQAVMPPTVGSGGPPAPQQKLKMSDWNREATAFARGRYRGREAEYQKLEAKFKAAQAAGQIDYAA